MEERRDDQFPVVLGDAVDARDAAQAVGELPVRVDAALRKAGRARRIALEKTGGEIGRHGRWRVPSRCDQAFVSKSVKLLAVGDDIAAVDGGQPASQRPD